MMANALLQQGRACSIGSTHLKILNHASTEVDCRIRDG